MGYHYARDCQLAPGQPGYGVPDPWEITLGSGKDCNLNGVPDYCDINVYRTSNDVNTDGVPDECQVVPTPAYFTQDAQFDLGTLVNVRHPPAPNNDRLERNERAVPLPYLWIPLLGSGTVALINTGQSEDDPEAGAIVRRIRTAPPKPGVYPSPARTAVDLDGNVWVTNRSLWLRREDRADHRRYALRHV
jgi:hypothetical protein